MVIYLASRKRAADFVPNVNVALLLVVCIYFLKQRSAISSAWSKLTGRLPLITTNAYSAPLCFPLLE
jgi:hypothetical protein